MNEPAGATSWKAVLLVTGGILLALLLAALLSQMDLLQKRRILPTERLQIIDLEATISAGEVTLVNLSGDVGVELVTPPAAAGIDTSAATPVGTAVPVFAPTCAAAPSGWSLYTIQEGDSLSSLAAQFDVTVEELRLANCLNGSQEFIVGQRVFVKQNLPTAAPEEVPDCTIPAGWALHVVTAGETLAALAVERNTTISLILRVNCMEDEDITAGTSLYLPSLTPPTTAATTLPPATLPAATSTVATATRGIVPAMVTRPLLTPTRSATMTATAAPNPAAVATRTPSTAPSLPLPVTATATVSAAATATTSPTIAAIWTPTTTASPSATVTPSATASAMPTATLSPPATATLAPNYPPADTVTPQPSATPSPTSTATPTLAPYPA
jgi:LysM repeat protein